MLPVSSLSTKIRTIDRVLLPSTAWSIERQKVLVLHLFKFCAQDDGEVGKFDKNGVGEAGFDRFCCTCLHQQFVSESIHSEICTRGRFWN